MATPEALLAKSLSLTFGVLVYLWISLIKKFVYVDQPVESYCFVRYFSDGMTISFSAPSPFSTIAGFSQKILSFALITGWAGTNTTGLPSLPIFLLPCSSRAYTGSVLLAN